MVSVNFEENECSVQVVDEEGTTHMLSLSKTYERIEPENSSWRFKPNRITIIMKKWLESSWKELTRAPGKGDKK